MQLCCPIAGTQPADEVSGVRQAGRRGAGARTRRELITSKMAKRLRPGKVFIDWSQNNAAKTTVAPYSLRAQAAPTASTPLTWDEVEAAGAGRRCTVRQLRADEVLARGSRSTATCCEPLLTPGPERPDPLQSTWAALAEVSPWTAAAGRARRRRR